ncbi:MAG: S41 family peptidase [Acidobacteriaceae bacterium]
MSEKFYALLLRLYPAQFRARYGEESLQLLRDRLRDEPGVFARLRLAFDLVTDLAVSLPRTYRAPQPTTGIAAAPAPIFGVLDQPMPRTGAFLFGAALAMAGLITFFTLLNYAGTNPRSRLSSSENRGPTQPRSSSSSPAPATAPSAPALTKNTDSNQAAPVTNNPPSKQTQNPAAASPAQAAIAVAAPIDPAERHHVITAAAQNLRDHYFDTALAQKTADNLLAQEKSGADNSAAQGEPLAVLLTGQIRAITHDTHLIVVYSATPLPPAPAAPSPADLARYRQAMQQQNCTIGKATILPHNIGYLRLNSFPDTAVCGPQITTALTSLNPAGAVIFDLRDNGGGYPDMVALVANRLFDRPQPWYNPKQTTDAPSFTQSPVPGSLLAGKPVYILTSPFTLSAAEQFTYNLKMLKRATIVGQTTGGAAHIGAFHRIDDHYGMGIPEIRVTNPYGVPDWEGVGVAPDVKIKSADALATAEKLAEARLRANQASR